MTILILSHQRCGSTSLLNFLQEASGCPALMEPFNYSRMDESFPEWRQAGIADIEKHYSAQLSQARLVKHIYGHNKAELDKCLVTRPEIDRLFVLYRDNLNAAALSSLVARLLGDFRKSNILS